MQVRRIVPDDTAAAWGLLRNAFGMQDLPGPPGGWLEQPGRHDWGVFDDRGRLVAKATDREQGHWFGGRVVPAAGIAGVAVAPERRGEGLGRLVLTRLLEHARERGAAVATLFRTSSDVYRRLGCEEVGAQVWTSVPASALALARPAGVTLRAAEPEDMATLLEVYRTLARSGSGLLERSDAVNGSRDGITAAFGADGAALGFASWSREGGYDSTGRLRVFDLFAHTADATRALLAMLGSWAAVTPTILLRLPDPDPAPLLASFAGARVESRDPWMLRVLDAPAAVAARGWPAPVGGVADLLLEDDVLAGNAGPWRLVLDGGEGRLEPGGRGAVRVTARGRAMLYAGAAGPALLRRAGLLDGDDGSDAFLAAATAGPVPALLDYF